MRVIINTDGGSRGNPGPAAIGGVITDDAGGELVTVSETIGITTNNVAEYTAVIRTLEAALDLGATEVTLRADSELLIRQLEGRYKVKAAHLRPLVDEIKELLARFDRVELEHVRRGSNTRADELVNQALDA
ncbi:MAG: ribonuclease HI family protein [Actinomycetota bacterium]